MHVVELCSNCISNIPSNFQAKRNMSFHCEFNPGNGCAIWLNVIFVISSMCMSVLFYPCFNWLLFSLGHFFLKVHFFHLGGFQLDILTRWRILVITCWDLEVIGGKKKKLSKCQTAQLPSTLTCVVSQNGWFLKVKLSICYGEGDTSVDNLAAGKNLLNIWSAAISGPNPSLTSCVCHTVLAKLNL